MWKWKRKKAKFNLSEEDFLKGNFRILEGIEAGKEPITLDAAELIRIHGEVTGIIDGREGVIKRIIKDKTGGFVDPNAIPSGYVHFADIERNGQVFVMLHGIASELQDIEQEIRELNNEDYFTNKIFK